MARVLKCDRCGKIYEGYEDLDNGSQVAFGHDEGTDYDVFTTYYAYDLCQDCIKAVKEFIEHGCDDVAKDCKKYEDDEKEYQKELDEGFLGEIRRPYLVDSRKLKEENKDGIRISLSSRGMSCRYPWGYVKREFASEPVKNHCFWKFLKWLDERDVTMTISSLSFMPQCMDFDFEYGDKYIHTTKHYDCLNFDNPNNDEEEFIKRLKNFIVKGLFEGEEE